jgi:hypothetical protein
MWGKRQEEWKVAGGGGMMGLGYGGRVFTSQCSLMMNFQFLRGLNAKTTKPLTGGLLHESSRSV